MSFLTHTHTVLVPRTLECGVTGTAGAPHHGGRDTFVFPALRLHSLAVRLGRERCEQVTVSFPAQSSVP